MHRKQQRIGLAKAETNRGHVADAVLAHLGIMSPPVLRCSSVQGPMTVTRLQSHAVVRQDYASLPRDDAWIFRLHLRELSDHRLWLNGRAQPVAKCSPGSVSIYDVQRQLAVSITDPLDVVRIFVPRTALDELAREGGVRQVTGFNFRHGDATDDPVIGFLVSSLLPSVGAPEAAFGLFVDHVMLAILTHVGRAYGAMDDTHRASRGKLAPWQERRAKEMLEADLNSNLRTAALAEACSLSPSHFARAFRQSTGLPPHRWLLNRRVDRAKEMMLTTGMSLPDMAAACGFADQTHFSRVFERVVGVPPGAWRRLHTCHLPQTSKRRLP